MEESAQKKRRVEKKHWNEFKEALEEVVSEWKRTTKRLTPLDLPVWSRQWLAHILRKVQVGSVRSIYHLYIGQSRFGKEAMVEAICDKYFLKTTLIEKRLSEKKNIDDLDDTTMMFFRLCEATVPSDLVLYILDFYGYDDSLLFGLGRLNSSWYLLILSSWKGIVKISRSICNVSLLVLKNMQHLEFQEFSFVKYQMTIYDLSYLFDNFTPWKIRSIRFEDGKKITQVHKVFNQLASKKRKNLVFPNCETLVFGRLIIDVVEKSSEKKKKRKRKPYDMGRLFPNIRDVTLPVSTDCYFTPFADEISEMNTLGRLFKGLKNCTKLTRLTLYNICEPQWVVCENIETLVVKDGDIDIPIAQRYRFEFFPNIRSLTLSFNNGSSTLPRNLMRKNVDFSMLNKLEMLDMKVCNTGFGTSTQRRQHDLVVKALSTLDISSRKMTRLVLRGDVFSFCIRRILMDLRNKGYSIGNMEVKRCQNLKYKYFDYSRFVTLFDEICTNWEWRTFLLRSYGGRCEIRYQDSTKTLKMKIEEDEWYPYHVRIGVNSLRNISRFVPFKRSKERVSADSLSKTQLDILKNKNIVAKSVMKLFEEFGATGKCAELAKKVEKIVIETQSLKYQKTLVDEQQGLQDNFDEKLAMENELFDLTDLSRMENRPNVTLESEKKFCIDALTCGNRRAFNDEEWKSDNTFIVMCKRVYFFHNQE